MLFVQGDGGGVALPHLEGEEAQQQGAAAADQLGDERVGHAAAAVILGHGHIGDVALVQHKHQSHIAHDAPLRLGGQKDVAVAVELDAQHGLRPGDGKAGLLDALDLRQQLLPGLGDGEVHTGSSESSSLIRYAISRRRARSVPCFPGRRIPPR